VRLAPSVRGYLWPQSLFRLELEVQEWKAKAQPAAPNSEDEEKRFLQAEVQALRSKLSSQEEAAARRLAEVRF
jgi:hypothetical protein